MSPASASTSARRCSDRWRQVLRAAERVLQVVDVEHFGVDLGAVLAAVHGGGRFGDAALRLVELPRGGGLRFAGDGLRGEAIDIGLDRRDLRLDPSDLRVEPGDRGIELAAPAADVAELLERRRLVRGRLADRVLQLGRPRVLRRRRGTDRAGRNDGREHRGDEEHRARGPEPGTIHMGIVGNPTPINNRGSRKPDKQSQRTETTVCQNPRAVPATQLSFTKTRRVCDRGSDRRELRGSCAASESPAPAGRSASSDPEGSRVQEAAQPDQETRRCRSRRR